MLDVDGKIFYALALAACYRSKNLTHKEKLFYLKELHRLSRLIKQWAKWCPVNFNHYHLLVSAELARIKKKRWRTMLLYDQAINVAKHHDAFHIAAIANELAAEFYLELGKQKFAV